MHMDKQHLNYDSKKIKTTYGLHEVRKAIKQYRAGKTIWFFPSERIMQFRRQRRFEEQKFGIWIANWHTISHQQTFQSLELSGLIEMKTSCFLGRVCNYSKKVKFSKSLFKNKFPLITVFSTSCNLYIFLKYAICV